MDADGPGTMITYAAKRVSTRDLLLDTAFDLFAEIGFAGTTISQIAPLSCGCRGPTQPLSTRNPWDGWLVGA